MGPTQHRKLVTAGILMAGLIVLAGARAGLAQTAPAPTTTAAPASTLKVTSDDLSRAGFTGITPVAPTSSSYLAPNTYFRVTETVASSHPEWGGAGNLVAVLIIPMPGSWTYGAAKVSDISGRTQVRTSRSGYYIVVTGPDKTMVQSLAQILTTK